LAVAAAVSGAVPSRVSSLSTPCSTRSPSGIIRPRSAWWSSARSSVGW